MTMLVVGTGRLPTTYFDARRKASGEQHIDRPGIHRIGATKGTGDRVGVVLIQNDVEGRALTAQSAI